MIVRDSALVDFCMSTIFLKISISSTTISNATGAIDWDDGNYSRNSWRRSTREHPSRIVRSIRDAFRDSDNPKHVEIVGYKIRDWYVLSFAPKLELVVAA
jgi:hypothetical protein